MTTVEDGRLKTCVKNWSAVKMASVGVVGLSFLSDRLLVFLRNDGIANQIRDGKGQRQNRLLSSGLEDVTNGVLKANEV